MKRHGLWSLIYGYKKMNYEFYKDAEGNFRPIAYFLSHTHKEIASKCIDRYFRMFVKDKTVGSYNEVVVKVCERIYSNWHRRGEHLTINGRKDCFRVVWNNRYGGFEKKRKFWGYGTGIERLRKWKPSEQNKAIAEKFYWKKVWRESKDIILELAWEENNYRYRCERLEEADEYKIEQKVINDLVKKLKRSMRENEQYNESN